MAEAHQQKDRENQPPVADEGPVETKDRGLFDFLGKKEEEKAQEEVTATEFEKVKVSEPQPAKVEEQKDEEEKKPGLLEKLQRSSSSSSSSSEEGLVEGEEKKKEKKEKKGLKEKLKEKISGEKKEEKEEDTTVPVEKSDEVTPPPPSESATVEAPTHDGEAKEKKGILDKIKEKLPGYHPKTEEEKEKEKSTSS